MPNFQNKPTWRAPAPKPRVPSNKPAVGALNNITFKQPGAFQAAPMPAFPAPPGWKTKTGGKTRRARRNKRSSTRKHSGGWW